MFTAYDKVAGIWQPTLRGKRHPYDDSIPRTSRRVSDRYLIKGETADALREVRKANGDYWQKLVARPHPKKKGTPSVPRRTKRSARIRTKTIASAIKKGNK